MGSGKQVSLKKYGFFCLTILLVCLMTVLGAQSVRADNAKAVKRGLVKEGSAYRYYKKDGTLLKNHWKTISGKKYYFKENGNAAVRSYKIDGKWYVFDEKARLCRYGKDTLVKIKNAKYYVNSNGNPIPGWHVIKGKLYYVYTAGKCAYKGNKDGITFTKDGYAKDDVHSRLKMKCMEVVSRITKPAMSQYQKLKTCWYHLNTIRFYPSKYPDLTKKTWPQDAALDLLNTMGGNCYGFATAFAALARELGYEPYLIEIPKCHCWVRINGLYWDNMGNRMGTTTSLNKYTSNQIFKYEF